MVKQKKARFITMNTKSDFINILDNMTTHDYAYW